MKVILQYVDNKWKERNKGDNKRIVLSKEEWGHVLSLYKIVQQKNYTGLGSLEVVNIIQENKKTKTKSLYIRRKKRGIKDERNKNSLYV